MNEWKGEINRVQIQMQLGKEEGIAEDGMAQDALPNGTQ